MAKDIKITDFIYPGCIVVCNTSAKCVNGYWPEIARVFHDRHIEWQRKRITEQMRTHVERLANEPHIGISASQEDTNFFNCPPLGE